MCIGKQMKTIVETIEDKNFSTCNSFMSFYGSTHKHIHTYTQNHTTTHGNNLGQQKTLELSPHLIVYPLMTNI